MPSHLRFLRYSVIVVMFVALFSCRKDPINEGGGGNTTPITPQQYNPDWTDASHGNVPPDYATVFPQNSVNTLEITIGSANWSAIRSNMTALFGADFGIFTPPTPGGGGFPSTETNYVDVTLKFNNKTWKNVGFRLKGNSSLRAAWTSGNYKLPFRLNFDEFEERYPGILNQHFYGFEEMSFSPGFKDQSLIREKIAADIFRLGGVAAPQTAFYRVYVDIGTGMKYWGVYCGIELPDDNMVKNQLGEESGNLYKPESKLATFVQSEFEKKSNETAADYSDVQTFIAKLNASTRTTNPTLWKQELEAVFNMPYFLKYLAINNAIVNWDTYGLMAHNYYLYNHTSNKIMWIPWDNNEALTRSPGITGTTGGNPMGGALSLTMNEVSTTWPLIRYVATDPGYFQQYKTYLKDFKNNVFTTTAMHALIDKYYDMITPYAIGINGEQAGYTYLTNQTTFTNERANLKTHVTNRISLVTTFAP